MTYILLCITVLCIIGSTLWSPGTIVLLDYVFTPHATVNWFEPLIFPILNILSSLFGTAIVSKGFFILILFLGAYLGLLIARYVASQFGYERYRMVLEVFGGIFVIINPFIYERMMVQPTIALAIFLMGYVIYHLFCTHRIILAGICAGIAFVVMPHASYMIVLIFVLYLLFFVRSWRGLLSVILAGVVTLMINLNWIVAPFFGHVNSASQISTFSLANMEAFHTQAIAPLDVISTNLLLYGFWGERYGNHYASVVFLSSLWYIAGIILIIVVLLGYYQLWWREHRLTIIMGIIGLVSLILGIGIASPVTAPIIGLAYEYLPLFSGYREPQKWIGLLMIVEGIGLLIGLGYILQRWGRDRLVAVSLVFAMSLIVLIWSPGPLMGYHGQLRTTLYPVAFETLRTDLSTHGFSGRILALPWHSYIGCSWIGRPTVSNPIRGLLSPLPVVSSDNIEVGDILYSNSATTESHDIEGYLQSADISLLTRHGFTHILLMRGCASSSETEVILDQAILSGSLIGVRDDATYRLYQIIHTR